MNLILVLLCELLLKQLSLTLSMITINSKEYIPEHVPIIMHVGHIDSRLLTKKPNTYPIIMTFINGHIIMNIYHESTHKFILLYSLR